MEKQIHRVAEMETYLNECSAATKDLEAALDRMDALKERMTALFQYYGSEEWVQDVNANIEEQTPAGVLSEDLVYDEITNVREAAIHMLETATDILKDRI